MLFLEGMASLISYSTYTPCYSVCCLSSLCAVCTEPCVPLAILSPKLRYCAVLLRGFGLLLGGSLRILGEHITEQRSLFNGIIECNMCMFGWVKPSSRHCSLCCISIPTL
jgi:hypothetical protein